MKKVNVVLLIGIVVYCSVVFTACTPSFKEPSVYEDLPEYYNPSTDYPMAFYEVAARSIAQTEKGYYFFQNMILYYFDKETSNVIAVCNRPECTHKTDSCLAYFPRDNDFFMQYYEGSLYLTVVEGETKLNQSYWLYKVDPNDCTRTKICQLPYGAQDGYLSCMMHRGYLYMCVNMFKDGEVVLSRIALNELSTKSLEPTLLYKHESKGFGKSYLFGTHYLFQYTESDNGYLKWHWIDIDLKTLETKEIALEEAEPESYLQFEREYEDRLIATYVNPNAYLADSRELIYYSYVPETGVFEPFVTIPDRGEGIYDFFSWDGKNRILLYMDISATSEDFPGSSQEFRIVDENYQTIKSIPVDYNLAAFIIGDADFSFFERIGERGLEIYAIDKRGEELKIVKVFE